LDPGSLGADGRGARRRSHHGIDVACPVAAILRAVLCVDLMPSPVR